jgi:hypothetical protein
MLSSGGNTQTTRIINQDHLIHGAGQLNQNLNMLNTVGGTIDAGDSQNV